MELSTLDSQDALLALKPDWDRLWLAQETRQVFQHFAWAQAFIQSFAPPLKWQVLVARDEGRICGLLPLTSGEKPGQWRLLGSPNADYQHMLGSPEAVQFLLGQLKQAHLRQVLLEELPEASGLLPVLRDQGAVLAPGNACPYIRLTAENIAAIQAQSTIKRSLKRLVKQGALELHRLETASERLQAVETLFAQHRARWDARGKPSQFHDPATCAFYRRLCESPELAPLLHFSVLKVGGQVVACHLGFLTPTTFIYYKPAYDPAVNGAGLTLVTKLIAEAHRLGLQEFDFTRGGESYKTTMATGVRYNQDARLFFSPGDRLRYAATEWLRRHVPRDQDGLAMTTKLARRMKGLIRGR